MTIPQTDVSPAPVPPRDPKKARNVPGLIAFILSIVGFVFACVPGALIIGWILLPAAFVLGIVALFAAGKRKGTAIAAVIIAVVGTVVGVVVFVAVVANSVSEAFDGSESSVSEPANTAAPQADNADEKKADAKSGTRENPAALGSAISSDDWDVTINSVNLDGTAAVLSANQFNDPPADGKTYAIVNLTATYRGSDSSLAAMVGISYVTASGEVVDGTKSLAVAPEPSLGLDELYKGGSVTGNEVLEIPIEADGVLRVRPGMFADEVFVATK